MMIDSDVLISYIKFLIATETEHPNYDKSISLGKILSLERVLKYIRAMSDEPIPVPPATLNKPPESKL